MNNEIKEIDELLNTLKTSSLEPHEEYTMEFSNREQKILLDYITNLQEENKRLKQYKEDNFLYDFEELQDKVINLQKENNELVKLNNVRVKEHNHIYNYMKDYKLRIDKANTLLDELLEKAYIDGEYILYDYSTSELLEVKQALQGEDKDVKR